MELIRKYFKMLKLMREWNVVMLDGRHIMIKLSQEEDYAMMFSRIYQIENTNVKFLKWTTDFDYRSEPPIAPIWIKLLGLRMHLFNK